MTVKKSNVFKQLLIGGVFATLVFAIGCNSEEKKEASSETPAAATTEVSMDTMPMSGVDTSKIVMDTATTRPTKTPPKSPTSN